MHPKSRPLAIFAAIVVGTIAIGSIAWILIVPNDPTFAYVVKQYVAVLAAIFLVNLLATWLAFGNYSIVIRLITTVLGVAPIPLADTLRFVGFRNAQIKEYVFTLWPLAASFVFKVAVVPLIARLAGWRIMCENPGNKAVRSFSNSAPLQFTLRQMFGWTFAVALVAALIHLSHGQASPGDAAVRWFIFEVVIWGSSVCLGIWVALGSARPALRSAVGMVCLGIAAINLPFSLRVMLRLTSLGSGELESSFLLIVIVAQSLIIVMTFCPLLFWRAANYRLVRVAREASKDAITKP